MKPFRVRWSLRAQLLVWILALLVGALCVGMWSALDAARRVSVRQTESQLRDVIEALAAAPYPLTENVLAQLKPLTQSEFVLVGPDGSRLTTLADGSAPLPKKVLDSISGMGVLKQFETFVFDEPMMIGGREFRGSGTLIPSPSLNAGSVLVMWTPADRWTAVTAAAVGAAWKLGAAGCFVAAVAAVLLAGRFARRIRTIASQTQRIADGDFSPIVPSGARDELRTLAEAINDMASRLSQLQEAVRRSERLRLLGQVGGGLAHQLRNGVAGARLAVQLHERDPQGDPEALQVALRQLTLVDGMLRRFLELGKAGELQPAPAQVGGVVDDAIALLRPQFEHRRVALHWRRPAGEPTLNLDAAQFGQLAMNLFVNALEAVGTQGSVEARLESDGACCTFSVFDDGPGPTAAVADRLFEAFATDKPEGVGLGLAVAKQIAEAHGGSLTFRRIDSRTEFRVVLPVPETNAR